MTFKELWEQMKKSSDEKTDEPKDFSFNRNHRILATVLMPTKDEIKKEEVGLGELSGELDNNSQENDKTNK